MEKSTKTSSGMTPVRPRERIVVIDVLRGFSILGILLVNMLSFAGYFRSSHQMGMIDHAAKLFIRFIAQAKFYTLFSFLFGWGMAIQMERAAQRSARFLALYVRRLLILLLIGLTHAILVWSGDILTFYALLGFPLLLFRKWSGRALLAAIAVSLLIPILISTPGPGESFRVAYDEVTAGYREAVVAGYRAGVYATGAYQEATVQRLRELRSGLAGSVYWAPHVFGMFLLGLYVGRRRIFHNISTHLPLFRKVMWWGLAVGIPLNVLWIWASESPTLVPPACYELATRGARTIAGSSLCLFYISAIVLLFQKRAWREWLSSLAPTGRMALTNYLLQSLICTPIFYGYGLGLYREVGPAASLVLTIVIYRLQIGLSRWWLKRYLFGPMEWLWRSLTYGRSQPLLPEWRRKAREAIRR
ncbi:MAG: DUF418 domain-containing protein [Anaerolineae bacterium]|jgi:uncharacterized protein